MSRIIFFQAVAQAPDQRIQGLFGDPHGFFVFPDRLNHLFARDNAALVFIQAHQQIVLRNG